MSKVKINLFGVELTVPATSVKNQNSNPYIYAEAKLVASLIKQYAKAKYGKRITVWASSDVYSGGSSVRVNVWSSNGSPTPWDIYEDIETFGKTLTAGSFNGMYDTYEYSDEEVSTKNGTPLKYFPSYVFVDNQPQWGTVEYWLNQWKNWDSSKYTKVIEGNTEWEKFVNWNSQYWKKGTLEKLVKYQEKVTKELLALGYTQEELAA